MKGNMKFSNAIVDELYFEVGSHPVGQGVAELGSALSSGPRRVNEFQERNPFTDSFITSVSTRRLEEELCNMAGIHR